MSDGRPKTGDGTNEVAGPGTILYTIAGEALTIEAVFREDQLFMARSFVARKPSGEIVRVRLYYQSLPYQTVFNHEQHMGEILTHPNIVKIMGRGIFGEGPFTVAEYFAGGSLLAWCRAHDRVSGTDVLSIANQVAGAVDFAHSRGVLHENICLWNVWLESDPKGRIALADFGLGSAILWEYNEVLALYPEWRSFESLAPELFGGDRPHGRGIDIYAFAMVLYQLAAGKILGAGLGIVQIIRDRSERDFPDIRTYRSDIPDALAARLAQTLSRDPRERPSSARAVLSGVEEYIARL